MQAGRRERREELANLVGRALARVRLRGIPRLLWLSFPLVAPPGKHTLRSATGVRVSIDRGDYFGCMMFYGRYSPEIISLVEALVEPGQNVLDVGAQVGYLSAHFGARVGPTGSVDSFEPDPKAFERLKDTLAANSFSWVKPHRIALSDHSGDLRFNVSATVGWSTAVMGTHLQDLSEVVVPAAKLDDLAARGELQRRPIHFIKIDVEGYECAVLDGMAGVLREDRPLVLCEVNAPMLRPRGESPKDVFSRFEALDYRAFEVRERPGLLQGGSPILSPLMSQEMEFGDVLFVPRGRQLPSYLF